MQADVYIQPLANAAGDYGDEVLVNDDLVNRLKISQRTNTSRWTTGLLRPAEDTLEFNNRSGRYSPGSSPFSIFAPAGADRARVRIVYPGYEGRPKDQTIYRGQISAKDSRQEANTGRALWRVRTPDIAFVDQSLNPGLITAGMTIREAIEAVFADLQIAAAIPSLNLDNFYDPNEVAGGTIIADEDALLGEDRRADAVLEKLLLACDCILTYVPYLEEARIYRRAEMRSDHHSPLASVRHWWNSGHVVEPLEISAVEDGAERVYNVIAAATGQPGEFATLVKESRGSISRWGRRTLSIDLSWVRNLPQVDRIIANLLARLSSPQRVLDVMVPALVVFGEGAGETQAFGQDLFVGGRVAVNLRARSPRGSARYGSARYGTARYARTLYPAISSNFYCEGWERDLGNDTIKLRLREFIDQFYPTPRLPE